MSSKPSSHPIPCPYNRSERKWVTVTALMLWAAIGHYLAWEIIRWVHPELFQWWVARGLQREFFPAFQNPKSKREL